MGSITHRGLLWAGGLAATPLPPLAAFGYPPRGLPWEGATLAPLTPARRSTDPGAPSFYGEFAPPSDPTPLRRL